MVGLNFKDVNQVLHIHRLHDNLQEILFFFLREADILWPDTTWVVTSVYRKDGGVHGSYRGIDLVPQDREEGKMQTMRELVNEVFEYGKPGLEICPDIHHGTAPHNHLQCRDNTARKEKANA